MPATTIGTVVRYNTTAIDRAAMGLPSSNVRSKLPAIIVAEEGPSINLKVLVDGAVADLWKTTVPQGPGEGQWDFIV